MFTILCMCAIEMSPQPFSSIGHYVPALGQLLLNDNISVRDVPAHVADSFLLQSLHYCFSQAETCDGVQNSGPETRKISSVLNMSWRLAIIIPAQQMHDNG